MKKVLVALSGGIDSAAAALILYERNWRVAAVTFDLTGDARAVESARLLAGRLRIPLIVEDLREQFRRLVEGYFIDSYLHGATPAPCSVCNPKIKWDALRRIADRERIPWIATGHYAQVIGRGGFRYIASGSDPVKDQSYYLWDLDQAVLARAVLPLGGYTKAQVRELMRFWGYGDLAEKRESMGVCFLGGEDYAGFLRREVPDIDRLDGGEVVDTQGNIIGSHAGFPFYTIGQRRGFALFGPTRDLYVTAIDPGRNRLTVGDKEDLYQQTLHVRDFRIVDPDEFFSARDLRVKVRGLGINPEGFCRVHREDNTLIVSVPSKAYAPASGQPVVFYMDSRVVGGGYLQ